MACARELPVTSKIMTVHRRWVSLFPARWAAYNSAKDAFSGFGVRYLWATIHIYPHVSSKCLGIINSIGNYF